MIHNLLLLNCTVQVTPIVRLHTKSDAFVCLVTGPPRRQNSSLALSEIEEFLESWFAVLLASLNGAFTDLVFESVVIGAAKTESVDQEFEDVFLGAVVKPSASIEFVEWFVDGS